MSVILFVIKTDKIFSPPFGRQIKRFSLFNGKNFHFGISIPQLTKAVNIEMIHCYSFFIVVECGRIISLRVQSIAILDQLAKKFVDGIFIHIFRFIVIANRGNIIFGYIRTISLRDERIEYVFTFCFHALFLFSAFSSLFQYFGINYVEYFLGFPTFANETSITEERITTN